MHYKDYYIDDAPDDTFEILESDGGFLVEAGFDSIEDCKLWIDELENEI